MDTGVRREATVVLDGTLGLDPGEDVRVARWPNALDALALATVPIAADGLQPPEHAVPIYLRERVALTEAERGAGRTTPKR